MADPSTVTDELVAIRATHYSRCGYADSARHILCLQDLEIRRRNMVTDEDLAAVNSSSLVVWTSDDRPLRRRPGDGGEDGRRPLPSGHRRR